MELENFGEKTWKIVKYKYKPCTSTKCLIFHIGFYPAQIFKIYK